MRHADGCELTHDECGECTCDVRSQRELQTPPECPNAEFLAAAERGARRRIDEINTMAAQLCQTQAKLAEVIHRAEKAEKELAGYQATACEDLAAAWAERDDALAKLAAASRVHGVARAALAALGAELRKEKK